MGSFVEITKRKHVEIDRNKLIKKLEDALVNIKTLQGFIPICAACKKIRDDKGFWQHVETYIKGHSAAEFAHSICPDCEKELYPGIPVIKAGIILDSCHYKSLKLDNYGSDL